jgi:putative restriction endonuclease
MPAIDASKLVNAILDAFQDSGASGILISPIREHPRRFIVETETGGIEVWVYAWTLTHGGRPSLPDEYRIQMTTVSSPLPLNPKGYTLLLGSYSSQDIYHWFSICSDRY